MDHQSHEFEAYPLELRCVKALLLQKQYRQCIVTCRKALDSEDDTLSGAHPLRDTFLRFYLALAHDELTRAMHNFSHAKILAFQQAEELYNDALHTIPTAQTCLAAIPKPETARSEREPSPELKVTSRHDSLQSFGTDDRMRPMSEQRPLQVSPPMHSRHNSLPVRSPPRSTSAATNSDFDDLESHDSFNEIMTPNRWPTRLERDYSSMSLLQPAQRQMSHHLMRPVRMGSPAKPYHQAPKPQQRFSLPRLNTGPNDSSLVRKQLLTTSEQASPVDESPPISPLDSEDESILSERSTISPVSPITPWQDGHWGKDLVTQAHLVVLKEHLNAIQTQVHTHVRLLQAAKQRTIEVKAARTLAHESMSKGQRGRTRGGSVDLGAKRLLSERSYWSFTTDEVREAEKKNRILAAKARGWKRERFEPDRYRDLAEVAISEL